MTVPSFAHQGRVVAIWGVPRSVSTAFEKTFTRAGGLRVVHEPFSDCYHFGPARRSNRYGDVVRPEVFDERHVLDGIHPAPGETVVLKDLCFQAYRYLPDEVLVGMENAFILRHPDLVIDSLRRLKPDFTEEELGFVALAEMFDRVTALGQRPVVVEGQVFREFPGEVLRRFCAMVDLPFRPRMLSWGQGRIRRWAPHEAESQAKWHATLEASDRIEPPEEACPPRPVELGEVYERALSVYERVARHAIKPASEMVMR